MKKILLSVLAALLVMQQSQAALIITEVMSSSAHASGTNNGDWFELTNTGLGAFDLTGFSWDDNSNTPGSANFGSITSIAAGQSIIFTEETIGTESSWLTNWGLSGVTVLHLGGAVFQAFGVNGDAINIYDASNALVTSVTFGAATTGFSFEWDSLGNSLALSVAGQNGAFQAPQNGSGGAGVDVASPGAIAVPEPSTYALLALGVAGLFVLRRAKKA